MSRVRMSVLDRTESSQDQPIRWQPSRIPLPRKGVPGGCAVENEGLKITVVGALAIAGVIVLLILLVRFLRDQGGDVPKKDGLK
jgi:hypothetical protein